MSGNALRRGRVSVAGQAYLVTSVARDRRPLLCQSSAARALVEQLRRSRADGEAEWLAWVVMPDHFHALMVLGERADLSTVMKGLKGRTARAAGLGALWQPGFHDHAVRTDESLRDAARYVLANPVRAGLVDRLAEYPWWGCTWLAAGDDPQVLLDPKD